MIKANRKVRVDQFKVKALRKKMCLSRAMLAERSQGLLSEATIKRAETGHRLSSRKIHDLATADKLLTVSGE